MPLLLMHSAPTSDVYGELAGLIGQVLQVAMYLVAGLFAARIVVNGLAGQLDSLGGRPGAIAEILQEITGLVLSLVLALNASRLALGFSGTMSANMDVLTGTDMTKAALSLFVPIFSVFVELALSLLVSVTMISVVYSALAAQISAGIFGNSSGLTDGIMRAGVIILILVITIVALHLGLSIVRSFL